MPKVAMKRRKKLTKGTPLPGKKVEIRGARGLVPGGAAAKKGS